MKYCGQKVDAFWDITENPEWLCPPRKKSSVIWIPNLRNVTVRNDTHIQHFWGYKFSD